MRLSMIEDHIALCSSMKQGLEKAGFQADVAKAGLAGEEKAYANE